MTAGDEKTLIPYGLWPSPFTPAMLSQRLRLDDVRWDSDGKALLWVEGRSGSSVVVSRPGSEAERDLSGEQPVKGGVGYGGGEFCVSQGMLVFCGRSGQLYRRSLGYEQARPITPAFGAAASPALSPDGRWIVYVWSDGKTDLLALVDVEGRDWPLQLVSGADFYMQPTWHPDGKHLAWVEWDNPNMPWDGARLMLASLADTPPRLDEAMHVAGDQSTPVSQPEFSPDGLWLSMIVSNGEWDDLLLVELATGQKRILVHGDGFHLAPPAWVQGIRSYGWSHNSRQIYLIRNANGLASLWQVDVDSGKQSQINTAPYTWINQLSVSPADNQLAFLASAPTVPDRIVRWDGKQLHVERRSDSESISPDLLPEARPISWQAVDGATVHGVYSPPRNAQFTSSGLPPAILHIHGGPTSQTPVCYNPEAAYFTSRGYAWLDVNYRGSTGYGHTYQNLLCQHWGDYDVEDAVSGARALAEQGLADGRRIVIQGGSAGGYTVLNALVRYPGQFKAGVCLYGVSNLFLLDMETHKFEAHYNSSMIGPLPEAAQRYHDWSAAFHLDKIRDPMAVFQGKEDKVVPSNQAEAIVSALRQQGVPYIYRLYEGEGHGFRKSETIRDYLEQTERFLQQYVLYT
ncbi:MAG: S9 family peptidase [Anaerolineaceae bacterium]|nr:S9 family peptidase [Anaerolineaceae bacterium]